MRFFLIYLSSFLTLADAREPASYDPQSSSGKVNMEDAEFHYGEDKRVVPLRLYFPAEAKKPAPVILFSHGLGGSCKNNAYTAKHWAGRGYAVVVMQHAGSDEGVWKDVAPAKRMAAMKGAASAGAAKARVADVHATLDQLEKWNAKDAKFAGHFDLEKVGMSGHSFGAVTTQAVSGQKGGLAKVDSRIDAALAFSPSPPALGNPARAFGEVRIPWMLMTGTNDRSVIGRTTPEKRGEVFESLPESGHFYELVLDGAEHMAFSDRTLRGKDQRDPKHHIAIKGLSSAFWDAYLLDNEKAETWLKSERVKGILDSKDVWSLK